MPPAAGLETGPASGLGCSRCCGRGSRNPKTRGLARRPELSGALRAPVEPGQLMRRRLDELRKQIPRARRVFFAAPRFGASSAPRASRQPRAAPRTPHPERRSAHSTNWSTQSRSIKKRSAGVKSSGRRRALARPAPRCTPPLYSSADGTIGSSRRDCLQNNRLVPFQPPLLVTRYIRISIGISIRIRIRITAPASLGSAGRLHK